MHAHTHNTIIWFYFEFRTLPSVRKLNARTFFNNETFTRVSYMIWGAYEIKTARNNNVRNIFNAKYNQIMVIIVCVQYVCDIYVTIFVTILMVSNWW